VNFTRLLACSVVVLAACAQNPESSLPVSSGSQTERQLHWLDRADPERDFAQAWARGDTRFVGVYGFAANLPGVDVPVYGALARQHGIRWLHGTSDIITSQEDLRLNRLAHQYAEKYNQLLLQHLRHSAHAA
jgi:hypothetical protein